MVNKHIYFSFHLVVVTIANTCAEINITTGYSNVKIITSWMVNHKNNKNVTNESQ